MKHVLNASIRFTLSAAFAITIMAFPLSTYGQTLSGMGGRVTDSSGAVVQGAKVTVTNVATGVSSHTTTTSEGAYTITDLIPGAYTVRVEKEGFKAAVVQGVNVEVAHNATADAVLQAGATVEEVNVTANAITIETEQPNVGTTVDPKLVAELPNEFGGDIGARDRQIDNFLSLTAGFTGGSFSHRINGGLDFQNEIVFNGVPVAQAETAGLQTNINPPFELVGDFRVLSSVFSAQYGLGQGAAVYQFSSGTNSFHGDAFEIMRNSYFDAAGVAPPGSTFNSAGAYIRGPVPADHEHNYGFTVGGPIIKNKTFFTVSADWYRVTQPAGGAISVPTADEKGGDFTTFCGGTPCIFVPQAFVAPAGCSLTPGTAILVIPAPCISTVSGSLLSLVPSPPSSTSFSNNLPTQISAIKTTQTNWGFNIDHTLTNSQALHFTFWRDSWFEPYCCDNGANFATSSPLTGAKDEPRLGTGIVLTYAKTFSPRLVMTAGASWIGEINNEHNLHLGFSFPGVSNGQVLPTISFGCSNAPCPNYAPTSWGAGNGGETTSYNRKLGLAWVNNWLYNHGRHNLNFGFDARRSYQDDDECQYCAGNIGFSYLTTSDPANPSTATGNAFASYLFGDVDQVFRKLILEARLRNFAFSPYVQDNFKLTPKLTLNFGLRWDILRPFTEKNNEIAFFNPNIANAGAIDPATGQPLMGGITKLGTCSGCAGYNRASIDWHQFSPRVGFAYEMNQKTSFLGGFALNRLDGGAYEYGTNKVAVNYPSLLAGEFNRPTLNSTTPGYGQWDNNPIPAPSAPPFSSAIGNGFGVNAFDRNEGFSPYNEAWNLGMQREVPGNVLMTIAYIGNRGVHLPSQLNPFDQMNPALLGLCAGAGNNCVLGSAWTDPTAQTVLQSLGFAQATVTCPNIGPSPGPSGTFFTPYVNFLCDFPTANLQQAVLPYPMYNGILNNFEHSGSSSYKALQIQAEKRLSVGLNFLVNWTVSRMMSNVNSGFTSFAAQSLNKFNQKPEWSIDNNDQTHVVNVSFLYELPIGPGKRFLNHSGTAAKEILGGWEFTTIAQYSSGSPFWGNVPSVGANGSPLNTGNRANYDPSASVSVNWNNYYKGTSIFSNTNAFSDPGLWVPGNSTRTINAARGPFNQNENMGLVKRFYFGERVSAQLRMEYFNIFNRVAICGADNNVSDIGSGFGLVSPGFPCQNNTPRHGQAFLKIQF